jgi:hypothetical protein
MAMDMPNMNETISDLTPAAYITFSGNVPSPAVKLGCGGAVALAEITENDVILGRGSNFDKHNGNVQLRHFVLQIAICNQNKTLRLNEKSFQTARIVAEIRNLNPSGRFLTQGKETGLWEEVGDVKARSKVAQIFRDFRGSAMKKASAERNQSEVAPVVQKGSLLLPTKKQNNDVFLGRGARKHPGNQYFRQLVVKNLTDYHDLTCTHINKTQATSRVVAAMRQLDPPSRFLRENKEKGIWEEVGDAEARRKVAQAFRDYRHKPKAKAKDGKNKKVLSRPIQIMNNDVLLGRGAHKHAGNVQFRQIVAQYFATFFEYQGKEKTKVAAKIVEDIHNLSPPGRFMSNNKEMGTWEEVKDSWAIKKVVQAFHDLGRPEK